MYGMILLEVQIMVFEFFFQAAFGIAAGISAVALLALFIYKRFIGGFGKGGKRC